MAQSYTLEYWVDDNWYVGKLKEVPGIFSQGATLSELEDNIVAAFRRLRSKHPDHLIPPKRHTKEIVIDL
ncbi:MAG: hypothetical protein Kow0031_31400 [Anaerolineae bacterium]